MKKSTIKIAGFMMLAMLLGGHNTASAQNFDLNGDGTVDVADMSALITYMAGESLNADAPGSADKNENREKKLSESGTGVDLGLPSGRKWADKNVGYSKDSDYGIYFSWGEMRGTVAKGTNIVLEGGTLYENKKTRFDWGNYEWMYSGETTWKGISKYQIEDGVVDAKWYEEDEFGNYQFIGDGIGELALVDDAARFNWGGKWRMPYVHEIEELLNYTTQTWKKSRMPGGSKDVWGCEFKGPNGKTIFLPAAGSAEYQYLEYRDGQYIFPKGKYWSRELDSHFGHDSSQAVILSITRKVCCEDEPDNIISWYERQYGLSIRPVLGDE